MQFSLRDRIVLMNVLPTKGSFEDLILREDIIKKVNIKQEELEKYDIKTLENGHLQWKNTDDTFTVELTEMEKSLIKKQLTDLNEKKELTVELFPLYRLFF